MSQIAAIGKQLAPVAHSILAWRSARAPTRERSRRLEEQRVPSQVKRIQLKPRSPVCLA